MENNYKFSLRKKLVIYTTILAMITYTTSGFFIYVLFDWINQFLGWNELTFTVVTLILGILWSGILAYFAAGVITKPLKNLERVATEAANGNIGQEITIPKSDDEIKSLGLAFEKMLHNFRDMVRRIDQNFNDTNESVSQITTSADLANTQAEMIRQTIEEISQGAENSSSSIQHTAESVEHTTLLATKVKEKAAHSKRMSESMMDTLDLSKSAVFSLVSGIQYLAEEQQLSLKSVAKLENNASEIEKIITLVGDLAEQTNLLALNASIEAARAGEHGKGFAVVAEEVRKLADGSAKAVDGISSLVSNMQKEVKGVVTQINNQVKRASEESSKGQQTNDAISDMSESITQVDSSVHEISELTDQQLQSLQETSIQSQEVSAIAEETSAGTEEVSSTVNEQTTLIHDIDELSQKLKIQAESLKAQILQFTFEEEKVNNIDTKS